MNFKSAVTSLPKGTVAFAEAEGDEMTALIKRGGAMRKVRVNLKTKAVKDFGTASYADECMITSAGRIERLGGMYFAADN